MSEPVLTGVIAQGAVKGFRCRSVLAKLGVKLIRLDENDEIAAITKLDKLEEENSGAIPSSPDADPATEQAPDADPEQTPDAAADEDNETPIEPTPEA